MIRIIIILYLYLIGNTHFIDIDLKFIKNIISNNCLK